MCDTKRSGRSGCLWAVVVLQFMAIVMLVLVVVGVASIGVGAGTWDKDAKIGRDDFPEFTETWSTGQGAVKVVRIGLSGPIFLGESVGMFGAPGATDMVLASIRRATNDPEVRGIILDIDSPGGGITASDVLHDALLEFKKRKKGRHVVAVFGDTAASGGYYVATAADAIVARPTAITGSLGVLLRTVNIQELARKVGIKDVTIKSGLNKDMLNPFKAVSEEQKAMLQVVIDDMHDRFVQVIVDGRGLPEEQVRELADGRVFTATQAKEHGLVDELGHWRRGKEELCELLELSDVRVVRYEEPFSLSSLLRADSGLDPVSAVLRNLPRTRLLYQWLP